MESETSGIERLHDQDDLTRIYGCATMWHESVEEMREMLKSVLRIDEVGAPCKFSTQSIIKVSIILLGFLQTTCNK